MNALTGSSMAAEAYSKLDTGRELPNIRHTQDRLQARKMAEDFEAVFLSQMLQPMFANLSAEKPFGGGSSEDMWRSMQVEEYGKAITKAGGIGIADTVYREIIKLQEMR